MWYRQFFIIVRSFPGQTHEINIINIIICFRFYFLHSILTFVIFMYCLEAFCLHKYGSTIETFSGFFSQELENKVSSQIEIFLQGNTQFRDPSPPLANRSFQSYSSIVLFSCSVSYFRFKRCTRLVAASDKVYQFTSCLPRVGGSLRVFRFLPPLKLVATIQLKYC